MSTTPPAIIRDLGIYLTRLLYLLYLRNNWIALKVCIDIRGHQRLNPKDFCDSLTFSLAPQIGQHFQLPCEISHHLLAGLP